MLRLLPDELLDVGGQAGIGDVVGDRSERPDQVRLEVGHRERERHQVRLAYQVVAGEHVVEFVGELELHLADRDVVRLAHAETVAAARSKRSSGSDSSAHTAVVSSTNALAAGDSVRPARQAIDT